MHAKPFMVTYFRPSDKRLVMLVAPYFQTEYFLLDYLFRLHNYACPVEQFLMSFGRLPIFSPLSDGHCRIRT